MNERYIVLKFIDDKWTPINHFDSAKDATDIANADINDTTAVYDQQRKTLLSYNIPPGSPLEALLKLLLLKQIEANLAGKKTPPGIFLG